LGVEVNAINMDGAIAWIGAQLDSRVPGYVCVTPAHSIMAARRDPQLLHVFNGSSLSTPDGMGVVWMLKLLGNSGVGRVYGPDLLRAVCKESRRRGWSHYFYGGAPGVADALVNHLAVIYPGLRIAGTYSPPFRDLTATEDADVTAAISGSGADIVWIGIGSPKQERWMAAHVGRVASPVLIGVGAAFDFLTGRKRQAPLWVQRSGLEWLFRLVREPRRLWRRYISYPTFAILALRQIAAARLRKMQ
jgi:N-acetylglucosaminyldiphosphoundecaprenol N-acetyl-beta-D-mannosaminyltransferase